MNARKYNSIARRVMLTAGAALMTTLVSTLTFPRELTAQTAVQPSAQPAIQPNAQPNPKHPEIAKVFNVERVKRWLQTGQASWYGLKFQGRKTATGEKFDMNSLTCAHRTLPLGSWVRVTNVSNRKSIFVRVNDRGPFTEDRIVDLSYAAARAVGLGGLSRVVLEPLQPGNKEMARALLAQNSAQNSALPRLQRAEPVPAQTMSQTMSQTLSQLTLFSLPVTP